MKKVAYLCFGARLLLLLLLLHGRHLEHWAGF